MIAVPSPVTVTASSAPGQNSSSQPSGPSQQMRSSASRPKTSMGSPEARCIGGRRRNPARSKPAAMKPSSCSHSVSRWVRTIPSVTEGTCTIRSPASHSIGDPSRIGSSATTSRSHSNGSPAFSLVPFRPNRTRTAFSTSSTRPPGRATASLRYASLSSATGGTGRAARAARKAASSSWSGSSSTRRRTTNRRV